MKLLNRELARIVTKCPCRVLLSVAIALSWSLAPGAAVAAEQAPNPAAPAEKKDAGPAQTAAPKQDGAKPEPAKGDAAKPDAPKPDPTVEIKQRVKELTPKIAEAEKAATPELAQQLGITPEEVQAKSQRLHDLKDIYDRQIAALAQIASSEKAVADLKAGVGAKANEKPVKSISDLDQLAESLDAQKLATDDKTSNITTAKSAVDAANKDIETAQKALDDSKQALDNNKDAAAAPRLQWNHDLAEIGVPLAKGAAALRGLEAELAEKEAALNKAKLGFLETAYAKARDSVLFTKNELTGKLEAIEKQRSEIRAERQEKLKNLALETARESDARADLAKGAEGGDEAAMQHKMAVWSMRDAIKETSNTTAKLLLEFIGEPGSDGYLDIETDLWKTRFDVLTGQVATRLDAAKSVLDKRSEQLAARRTTLDSRVQVLRRQVNDQRKKVDDWKGADADKALAEKELEALSDRARVYYRCISYLDGMNRMIQRMNGEISARRNTMTMGERLDILQDQAKKIWNKGYENPATKTTVTVGNVISALILLGLGMLASRRVTRALRGVLMRRARVDENAAATLERVLYYLLIALVVLAAMYVVDIPLTVFTFFGGALAIGVGFGAQNIVNNFISGLILMVERPIKINDLVEVDGQRGRIISIGARCCQLRLSTGVDILVPNSHFLERNVVNSTLTDTRLQTSIRVGVAYGSPVREVARLMQKAADDHGKVMKTPEPTVLFQDFGDSALLFELLFWVDLGGSVDPRVVCSDLRFIVERLFGDAGIAMAYPQRDVHIDSLRPLEVRLTQSPVNPMENPPSES